MTTQPCRRCNGSRFISVKHGRTFDDDSAAERALAWHREPCPLCVSVAHSISPDSAESTVRETQESSDA